MRCVLHNFNMIRQLCRFDFAEFEIAHIAIYIVERKTSRECDSRELFVFGHSSEPSGAFPTKLGRSFSSQPLGPFQNVQDLQEPPKINSLQNK